MNKKGFTLIELLAVIVILAIIALIATPIVLNIISDTNEQADLRSADFYLDALELSIAQATLKGQNITDGTYNILKNGNLCLEYENTTCKEELKIEAKGKKPEEGTITISNGQIENISVNLNNKEIVKNEKGELTYLNKLNDICDLKNASSQNTISAGDKYECEVKPGTKYTFYVLTTPEASDTHVSLIMDKNICEDGTPTNSNKTDKCLVPYSETGVVENGPVTAMNYLTTATNSWSNIHNLNIIYNDEIDYTEEVILFTGFEITGKARMPYHSEVKGKTVATHAYLFENISSSGPYDYWTLSADNYVQENGHHNAYHVFFDGGVESIESSDDGGVRPVILLKIK